MAYILKSIMGRCSLRIQKIPLKTIKVQHTADGNQSTES